VSGNELRENEVHIFMSRQQNAEQSHSLMTRDKSLKNVARIHIFNYHNKSELHS